MELQNNFIFKTKLLFFLEKKISEVFLNLFFQLKIIFP
jgi:hypothetical protein